MSLKSECIMQSCALVAGPTKRSLRPVEQIMEMPASLRKKVLASRERERKGRRCPDWQPPKPPIMTLTDTSCPLVWPCRECLKSRQSSRRSTPGRDEHTKPPRLGFPGSGEEAAALIQKVLPPSYIAVITDAARTGDGVEKVAVFAIEA